MNLQSRSRRHGASLLFIALLATACSGSATTTVTESADSDANSSAQAVAPTSAAEPTEEPATEPAATAVPEPTPQDAEPTLVPEPTPEPEPEVVFFGSELQAGDCFNRLEGNPEFQPPTTVSCDDLHEEEVYATAVLSDPADAPYPGEDVLVDRVSTELCNAATVDFTGEPWERLALNTFVLYPAEAEWAAGDRNIMCTAASSEIGTLKIGTAAGGSIDSDDVLLIRSGLANDGEQFDDWTIVTEHANIDTLGSVTDGQFELSLRRPFAALQGFVFNAKAAGDDGHATSTWGYRWDTLELTDLGSLLPGQEVATTVVVDGGDTIFAARATPNDDFDLWTTANGDPELLIAGDGNQRFPTLTPDQTRLVYQDNGDIWVANINGSDPLQLTSGDANDFESIVSPDGTTVVFASDRSGNDDLWAVGIVGGEPINLTNHPADESWPVFSEDGAYIYFASDRLFPEDDRSYVMVMNSDGSDQSWFAANTGSQPVVVPTELADQVLASAPTLVERYSYELLEGEPGTTTTWAHSSGRLTVDLPAGWRVGEFNELPGFLASPRPETYFEIWEIDGVEMTLWDNETEDSFFAIFESSTAVQSCEQFDGTDGIIPIAQDVVGISANFNCGSEDAVGGVIALYNQATSVGVIIEGQRDNLPDVETDSDMLTAIASSLVWG